MNNKRELDREALSAALETHACYMEARLVYYKQNGRISSDNPKFGNSDSIQLAELNIALLAGGVAGVETAFDADENYAKRSQIIEQFNAYTKNTNLKYMDSIYKSLVLDGFVDANRIRHVKAEFVLMNTPSSTMGRSLTRVFGELAGLLGNKAMRDEVRSLPEIRKNAQSTLDEIEP